MNAPDMFGTVDYGRIFQDIPTPHLVLSPTWFVVAVNDAYLRITRTRREDIVDRLVFNVFPCSSDLEARGSWNLSSSLSRAMVSHAPDVMPVQKYEIPRPAEAGDGVEAHWWSVINSPVLDEHGDVIYLVSRVDDVTDFIREGEHPEALLSSENAIALWQRIDILETEMLLRAQERHQPTIDLSEAIRIHNRLGDEPRFRALVTATSQVLYAMSADWGQMLWLHGGGFLEDAPQPTAVWLTRYIHPDDQKQVMRTIRKAVLRGKIFELEHRVLRTDGTLGWVHSRAVPIHNALGETLEWFGAASDVTERKAMETRLQDSERRSALALKAARTAVWELDMATRTILPADDLLHTMLGYAPGEPNTLEGWIDLIHEEDRPGILQLLEDVIRGVRDGYPGIELRYRARDKSWRWILCQAVAAQRNKDGKATRLVGSHTDIHDRKTAVEHALYSAQLDTLTGLPNRKLLYVTAAGTLAAARRLKRQVAVLFLDLDGFKAINDEHGHEAGDQLLQSVADRLKKTLRGEDVVGRVGGDEFVVILGEFNNVSDIDRVTEHIVGAIERPHSIGPLSLAVSTSIGISLYPQHGETIQQLVREADWAMYAAKKAGRGRHVYFEPGITMGPVEGMATDLNNRLQNALTTDDLYVVFQPVVTADRPTAIVAVEALLRWRQPDGSYMSPQAFLPAAESTGLVNAIGNRLLRMALGQCHQWQAHGFPDLSVAINVSAAQFRHEGFVDSVATAIKEIGIESKRVILEVVESTLMGDEEQSLKRLAQLKALGVQVAIDSFGTGYSNMRHLSRLQVDELKVDRAVIQSMQQGPEGAPAVDLIVAVGHARHAEVVAKGVEDAEALDAARLHGCQYVQGFYVGRPMPASEFATWLEAH